MLSQENRPLHPVKKTALGNPDVFPQKAEQKEDRLSTTALNVGFPNEHVCQDEYGSARKEALCGLNQSQVVAYINGILNKKIEYNTLNDGNKRKPQVQKEHFLLVTPNTRHKQYVDQWMSYLANGSKSLASLAKKVPIFNKKEEYIQSLFDFSVPNLNAAWYLKMTVAYNQTQNENRKTPRRHLNDPSLEWTQVLTKYMGDLLQKIIEYYGGGQPQLGAGFLTTGNQIDIDNVNKQWNYCDKLALHMYQEGLLDRQEYLSWAIDLLENMKVTDDNILRIMISLVFQYIKEIVKQYLLSRKLAQFCGRKLSQMTTLSGYVSPRSASPHLENSASSQQTSSAHLSTLSDIWSDYTQCNQHRSIVYMTCSMMQSVVLGCPAALVWLNLGEGKSSFIQPGSPLDILPCHPCTLPMPPADDVTEMRKSLRQCEIEIARRSMAAELSWSSDKVQQSMTGFITGKLLCILDKLDRYDFDKARTSPAINQIYEEIISIWNEKTNNEPYTSLEPLVFLLCDWAITTNRLGDHRPVIVAKLLEKHQTELWNSADEENEERDAGEGTSAGTAAAAEGSAGSNSAAAEKEEDNNNIFHDILLKYLDKQAPLIEEGSGVANSRQFTNCVALYAELIRLDLFNHDQYICTLISRGDLNQSSTNSSTSSGNNKPQSLRGEMGVLRELMESEDEQNPGPSSERSDYNNPNTPAPAVDQSGKQSRHLQYVTHFPIPQEEQFTHECNQRTVVLFGVGKGRENIKHHVRKVNKDLQKLFSKKCSMDVTNPADTGKFKVRSETELNTILTRFQSLPYYDQYCIASSTMEHIIEMFEVFVSTRDVKHVPLVEHIMFFLDLAESSLNITAVISFCEKLISRMHSIDYRIREIEVETKQAIYSSKYAQQITVYSVGVLRCHLPSLLLDPQSCLSLFQGMVKIVQELRVASECSSAQRCILYFLYVLFQASNSMRQHRSWADFEMVTRQIQDLLCMPVSPAMSHGTWNRNILTEYYENFNIYKFRFDAIFSHRVSDNRTSFVNNTILYLCQLDNFHRVNEVALMCAEFTAYCSHLSADWLGVLKALCCSSVQCGYTELLSVLNVSKLTTQQLENIAIFCAILIARHGFSLTDFLKVALVSLTRHANEQGWESGCRLTLAILLRVFKADTSLKQGLIKRSVYIKSSCDLHLLAAANRSITLSPLLAALKAIFMLANTVEDKVRHNDILSSLADDITDEEDDESSMNKAVGRQAQQVLADICSEDWVREKFLQDPEKLLEREQLTDRVLKSQEVWRLVQLICRRRSTSDSQHDNIEDFGKQQNVITRILRSLDQWNIRVAWLELQLMYTWQNPNSMEGELSLLLDNIARATIEVFHSYTGTESEASCDSQKEGVWLVAPLIAKLSTNVQGRVLQSAALVLEKSNKLWQQPAQTGTPHRQKDKERENSMSLLNHQPFLALVLTCLKGHDEQREGILSSLQSQLDKFVSCATDDCLPTDPQLKQLMHEALQLRLSLIGGMFDTIQRTHSVTGDWAHILNKLIYYGIVDVHTNNELFYTVLDMLSALIHSTLVSDSADSVENSKKPYHLLIKKIKKELGDRQSDSLNLVRQLLPISKHNVEIIACESHGSILDSKGNKIQGFESISKKSGLQVSNKHKISPWELIEGLKNPNPLCWQWFGAVKVERKLLDLEEQHNLMLHHTHNQYKSAESLQYNLTPPTLPPEDTEQPEIINIIDDGSKVTSEQSRAAQSIASHQPVPKSAGGKLTSKRRPSRTNSQTKASPYPAAMPAYGGHMRSSPAAAGIPGSAGIPQSPGWVGRGGMQQPTYPGYNYQQPVPQGVPTMARMHPSSRGANMNVQEALKNQIRNRQGQAGMMGMHNTPPQASMPGAGAPGYGMEVDGGPGTKERLNTFLHRRGQAKMDGGGIPEGYDSQPPPPQYNPAQYGRMPANQSYMSQQPPSYGAPPQTAQGSMMMGAGGQPQHSSMMSSYSGGPQQSMSRAYPPPQGGVPTNVPPGAGYNPQYQQQQPQYQAPDGRMMQPGGQYIQRMSQQAPPGQPPPGGQYQNYNYN